MGDGRMRASMCGNGDGNVAVVVNEADGPLCGHCALDQLDQLHSDLAAAKAEIERLREALRNALDAAENRTDVKHAIDAALSPDGKPGGES